MKHCGAFPLYTSPGCELKRLLALCLRATFATRWFFLNFFFHRQQAVPDRAFVVEVWFLTLPFNSLFKTTTV